MMLAILAYVGMIYFIALFVWIYYLVVMKFKWAKDNGDLPGKIVVFHAYLFIALGAPVYIFLNLVPASIIFLDPPREIQFTKRCQRYIRRDRGVRRKMAKWICRHWLDPFDEGGHC